MATVDFHGLPSLKVVVLAGGESAEREISLQSGAAVAEALSRRGHRVVQVDPASVDLDRFDWSSAEVVFIALHGKGGEDGTIQEILQEAGIPYTGSDATTSRLAFSKSASKERFAQFGVPTPAYVLIHESDDAARIAQRANSLGFPLVVKPDAQGSSLGVSIAQSAEELPQALGSCFHYDSFGILESAVGGTEWTVGFLDDLMLPPVLIETRRPFFDYQAKYLDDGTSYHFDFPAPADVVEAVKGSAQSACRALATRGLARVDLRLDKYGRPWVLEVNTIPGLTDHSLIPMAAARAGIELGELCQRALKSSLKTAAAGPHR